MNTYLQHGRHLLLSGLLITSCFACKEDPAKKIAVYEQRLSTLNQEMTAANGAIIDKAKATQFIETAEQYATLVETSDPEKYVNLTLKAAGLAKTIENPDKAIQLYKRISDKVPQHPKAPMALFMQGFIYENDMSDLSKAKEAYEAFLQKYPNDPDFVDDAQMALKNLGKSPEELIRQFEQQNKEDTLKQK